MKNWKRLIAVMMLLVLALTMTACSGGDEKKNAASNAKTETFTFWVYHSVDSSFYTDYSENPVMRYLKDTTWGESKTRIAFEYWIPPAGTASDNFSTMVGSGDYADVIQNTIGDTAINSYTSGLSMDITEYVLKYMPNYLAFLEANPDVKDQAVTMIDGEEHYLGILSVYDDYPDQMWGHIYRRDWIVKYGAHPVTGEAFSGGYTDENDPDSWQDNVVFPSGGSDPMYISDWEWMFGIFEKAYTDLGLTDSYCISVPYNGYTGVGELSASFGGGASGAWFRTLDNQVTYGPVTSQWRAYLQCMNTWYQKGWLDPIFDERTSDMFYFIDNTSVYQGKIGMWYGLPSQLGNRMDTGDSYTKGICAYAARTPINDIYGGDENKFVEPYCGFGANKVLTTYLISTKAEGKDIGALLSYFDYFYGPEGSILKTLGLSKEQYEQTKDPFMTSKGLTEGAYTAAENGTLVVNPIIRDDSGDLGGACCADLMPGVSLVKNVDYGYSAGYRHFMDEWSAYENLGFFQGSTMMIDMDEKEMKQYNNHGTKVGDYISVQAPKFIKGELDPMSETDWGNWCTMMKKYGYEKILKIVQPHADAHPIHIPKEAE